jgi:hypothetical protein
MNINRLIGIKFNKSDFKTFSLIFIFLFGSINIKAQQIVPDSIVKLRIQYIQNILEQNKTNANRWYYGWLAGYSAATIGQGTVYFISKDKVVKQNMALGAATTFLGAMGQLLTPMDPGQKAEILAQIPDSTLQDRLKKLTTAEELLNAAAFRETLGRSWQAHILCGVVNISSGIITWRGFKQSIWAGIGNFALNTAITETQIWTQPTNIMKAYHNYCNNYVSEIEPHNYNPKLFCYVSAYPGGISIRLVF